MQLQNAAQAGVDWAVANHVFNATAITNAANLGTDNNSFTISLCPPGAASCPTPPLPWCGCPSSTGVTFSPYTAGQPCAPPGCGSPAGLYAFVQTQTTHIPLFGYGLFSGGSRTLTGQATARIQ
jgi:hypothetical protein